MSTFLTEAVRVVPQARSWALPSLRLRLRERHFVYGLSVLCYLAVGLVLVYKYNVIDGDNLARVQNGSEVLQSNDPHLAAIGFVWNPLPSLVEMPMTMLRWWWPDIVRLGLAGIIMSSAFMAGAVYQLNRTFLDARIPRFPRLAMTALFAVHPLMLYNAGSGMAEAPLLFFLILTVRHTLGWVQTGSSIHHVMAGLALAFAYLTRYEPVFSGVGLVSFFFAVSFLRSHSNLRARIATGTLDAVIVGAPLALTFALWAMTSWIIVGHPFEQLSSIYGNASQLRVLAQGANAGEIINTGGVNAAAFGAVLLRLVVLEPFFVGIAATALLLGIWRRDARPIAVIAIFGPLLAFEVVGYVFGLTGLLLRYFITVIPITALLAGLLIAPRLATTRGDGLSTPASSVARFFGLNRAFLGRVSLAWTTLCLLLMLAVAVPASAAGLITPSVGKNDALYLRPMFLPDSVPAADRAEVGTLWVTERHIATYLDQLSLPRGSVLVDSAFGFAIPLASKRPEQFVITSDRDFEAVVADPVGEGVRYVLVPAKGGVAALDAIDRAYPQLYDSGQGIQGAHLVASFVGHLYGQSWRLYGLQPSKTPKP